MSPRADRPIRVLFAQYHNPGAYPPVIHAAHILAGAGASVRVFGVVQTNTSELAFGTHPSIRLKLMGPSSQGWRLKLHYVTWVLWTLVEALRWRADVVYMSDPLAAPAGLLAALLGKRVIYHEHDAPPSSGPTLTTSMRVAVKARRALARRASLCVFPGERRLALFQEAVGSGATCVSVMNCPRLEEVGAEPASLGYPPGSRVLHYHGSLGPNRLPLSVIRALAKLPSNVILQVVGYESLTTKGYVDEMKSLADELGVGDRLAVLGAVPERRRMFAIASAGEIGLLLMTGEKGDPNSQTMAGASNKLFDYLACRMSVVVSETSGLRDMVLDTGLGRTCVESDPEAIADAIRLSLENPDREEQGRASQAMVMNVWNYDTQFEPVLRHIMDEPGTNASGRRTGGRAVVGSVRR